MTPARVIVAAIVATGLVAGFNYIVDPLQLFRPARFYRAAYPSEERLHNAGLIRSQSFDTIFMGDSIGLHVRGSEVDDHLGTHSVKLVMSGSSSREQTFVLTAALAREARKVVWEMDDLIFTGAAEVDNLSYFPADLYRMNAKGLVGYLLNLETSREAFFLLLRGWKPMSNLRNGLIRAGHLRYDNDNANELNVFADALVPSAYNAAKCLAAYKYYAQPGNGQRFGAGYDYDVMVNNFERDAVGLIQQRPDIQFIIYFPPYSMVQYAAMRDLAPPDMLPTFFRFSSYALERLSRFPNVALFDFRDAAEISHDLDRFADAIHHSPTTGLLLLSRIAKGNNRVDPSNSTRSVEHLKAQVDAYKLPL